MVFAVAASLWPGGTDSSSASWIAAATGAERIPVLSRFSVWDGASGTIGADSAVPLVLARIGGAPAADATYAMAIAGLALVWATAAVRIAAANGSSGIQMPLVLACAAFLALRISNGQWRVLAAAPLAWLMANALTGAGSGRILAAVAATALTSYGGAWLAIPFVVVLGLVSGAHPGDDRRARIWWIATAVLIADVLLVGAPEWTRVLRHEAPHSFAPGGSFAPVVVPPRDLWKLFGGAVWECAAAIVLFACAAFGARHSRAALGAVSIAIVGILFRLGYSAEGALAHGPLLRTMLDVFPAAVSCPLPQIATVTAAILLTGAAFGGRRRVARTLGMVAMVLLLVLAWPARPTRSVRLPVEASRAEMVREGNGIALPLAPADDLVRRRSEMSELGLVNGLQTVLERNPGLLATELAGADPSTISEWLDRLDLDWARTPGGAVVRRRAAKALPPCLPSNDWEIRATRENPEVSIAENAIDGRPETRWGTGRPQRAEDYFAITLPAEVPLHSLELDASRFLSDRPRGFRVQTARDGASLEASVTRDPNPGSVMWSRDGRLPYYDGGRSGRTIVRLHGKLVRQLRIELTRTESMFDWSIGEICLRPAAAHVD